jgi:hypothetical protein
MFGSYSTKANRPNFFLEINGGPKDTIVVFAKLIAILYKERVSKHQVIPQAWLFLSEKYKGRSSPGLVWGREQSISGAVESLSQPPGNLFGTYDLSIQHF